VAPVEAKANMEELQSTCGAKPQDGLQTGWVALPPYRSEPASHVGTFAASRAFSP
jgi:hypothetical protein